MNTSAIDPPSARSVLVVLLGGAGGGAAGGLAGFAMDRFPVLGLAPETFWRTDPENVWALAVLVGVLLGAVATALVLAGRARRRGPSCGASGARA